MAASNTVHLQIFKSPQLPHFSTDLDETGYCHVLKQWMRLAQVKAATTGHERRCMAGLAGHFTKVMTGNITTNFRTPETDPTKHSAQDEGLFYTMPQRMFDDFVKTGIHPSYSRLMNTFNENTIMVRKPALEIFDIVDNLNLNHPPLKIVLYGKRGTGRTMTMSHVMHRYAEQDWVIVHAPWVGQWIKFDKDREPVTSFHNPDRLDYPKDAAKWLKIFYSQNEKLIGKIQTTKEYKLSSTERSDVGTPLSDLANLGVMQKKFASDVIGIILRELRVAASAKQIKILVAIDGLNGFWKDANINILRRKKIPAKDVSIVHNFKKMLEPTWSNGVVLGIVDDNIIGWEERDSYTPYSLLGPQGFAEIDPFLPIEVPNYSEKEVYSCLEYYMDRMWIQRPEGRTPEGQLELIALSNKNPHTLMQLCAQW